ncbi:15355_t:CDS:2, partial [Entrophospora sp. SA101]
IYEAFVIYCFFNLLVNCLGGERSLLILLHGRPPTPHLFPVNFFLRDIDIGDPYAFLFIKRGILQYVYVKPILSLLTMLLKWANTYQDGHIATTDSAEATTDSAEGISVSIQDFLITFEMVMGSIAHWYAFSFKDYIDPNYRSGRMPIRYAFKDCMGFKDVLEDTLETIRGSRFNYRTFEPAEGMAYIGPSRTARIMAGLRFTGGGSGKYWLPGPNNSRSSLSSERADDDDKNSLNFPDPTPDDEVETMYDYSRRLGRFGDYNFPNKKGKARAKDIFNNNDDDNEEYDFFEDDELINNRIRNGSSSKNRQLSDPNVSPFRIGCIDLVREIPNSDGKRFERFIDRIESSSSSKSFNKINEDKCKVITQIVEIMCELKKHKFPKIGGIFIDPDTQEFTVAAIKKEIKYIKTAHTQEKQEKWTPVYEILAELVPNFFSKDDKERFVPTHGDLHPTNIVMEGTKITGNPFASTTEEEIKEHEELQKFFREQMKKF